MAKVRAGFVSNSSSSSFCVWGAILDADETEKLVDNISTLYSDDSEVLKVLTQWRETQDEESIFNQHLSEIIGVLNKKKVIQDIEFNVDWEGESLLIGRSYSTLKDTETGSQFKRATEKTLRDILPEDTKLKFINDTFSY